MGQPWSSKSFSTGSGINTANAYVHFVDPDEVLPANQNKNILFSNLSSLLTVWGVDIYVHTVRVGLGASSVATNTVVGFEGLNANTTGNRSTAIGYQAMKANTEGEGTALGYQALTANTTGIRSTAIGRESLTASVTGDYNIAIGYRTMFVSNGASYNTSTGADSLRSNVAGSNNSIYGYGAAYNSAATGDYANNIVIGYQAANNITNGANNNIVIGYDIDLPVAGGSNQMSIGNLIYGTGISTTGTTVSTGKVGLAIATPLAGFHNAFINVASTPSILVSGTPYAAGSAITNKPMVLFEPTGTTSTAWSLTGTMFGINAASTTYAGNIFDFQAGGTSRLSLVGNASSILTLGGGGDERIYFNNSSTRIVNSNGQLEFSSLGGIRDYGYRFGLTGNFTAIAYNTIFIDTTSNYSASGAGAANYRHGNFVYTINNTGAQTGTATGVYISSVETTLGGMANNLISAYAGAAGTTLMFNLNNVGNVMVGGLLQLVGTTSSFPALKRSSAALQVRLADDSAYAGLAMGAQSTGYIAKTGTYTITIADYTIDCTTGTFTVTLPTAVGITGQLFVIKNTGAGVITIATTSSQTIDGVTTQSLSSQYSSYTVQSNGANWIII